MLSSRSSVCVVLLLILSAALTLAQEDFQQELTTKNDTQEETTTSPPTVGEKTLDKLQSLRKAFMKGWYAFTNAFLDSMEINVEELVNVAAEIMERIRNRYDRSGGVENEITTEFIQDVSLRIFKANKAVATCVVVGFLYVVIMLLLLLLLPCFRICCNLCGGKRTQLVTKKTDRWRLVNTALLVVIVGVMATACTTMMVASGSVYTVTGELNTTVVRSADVISGYTSTLQEELNSKSVNPLQKVKSSVSEAVKRIEFSVTDKILNSTGIIMMAEDFSKKLDLDALLSNMKNLTNSLDERGTINEQILKLKDLATDIKENCTLSECSGININFGDIDSKNITIDTDAVDKVRNSLLQFNTTIEEIKVKISETFEDVNNDLDTAMDGQEKEITNFIGRMKKSVAEVSDNVDIFVERNIRNQKDSHVNYQLNQFRTYIWGGMIGYAAVPTILTAGLLLGLLFGICGHSRERQPDERKGLSHAGGLCLVGSVYFFLCFAAVWMLILVSLFITGGSIRWYACNFVEGDKIDNMDRVLDLYQSRFNATDLLVDLLKPGIILRKCKQNLPLSDILNVSHLNIPGMEELQKNLDDGLVKAKEKIALGVELDKYVKEIGDTIKNFKENQDELQTALNKTEELKVLKKSIENITTSLSDAKETIESINDPKLKQKMEEFKNKTDDILTNLATLRSEVKNMMDFLDSMEKNVQEVEKDVQAISEKLQGNITEIINDIIKMELKTLNFNVEEIARDIFGDSGRCKPLYEVYEILSLYVCDLALNPVNGYIIAMGACLAFYIPAIIVAFKLSKHYLKVTPEFKGSWELDCEEIEINEMTEVQKRGRRPTGMVFQDGNNSPRKKPNGVPNKGGHGKRPNYHY